MDDSNLARVTRASLARARVEAKQAGSRALEAEHLILALAAERDSEPAKLLAEAGLDYESLADAFREERKQSLAYAGVELAFPAVTEWRGTPVWASSAREALLRGHAVATRNHHGRLNGVDLLVGILKADLGTVPRALALAGVDRTALIARATA
jgi:ATP-dependent Clp protease ATP-binding subunit ClpA